MSTENSPLQPATPLVTFGNMQHPQAPWVSANPSPEGIVVHCSRCGALATVATPNQANQIALQHRQHGLGDVVAAATKAVGIKPCTPCEARQRALNGWFPRVWGR